VSGKSVIYEKTYRNYLKQVADQDFSGKQKELGIRKKDNYLIIPFWGNDYRVNAEGIVDDLGKPSNFAVSVVLLKYLLHFEPGLLITDQSAQWVSYRNFKNAAPLVNYFSNTTEKAIAQNFSGKLEQLAASCRFLGGRDHDEGLAYDLTMKITPLPRIPIYLLFNDADDEFPAECSVLFQRRVEQFLDMECVAIVGGLLSDFLFHAAVGGNHNINIDGLL